MNQVQATCKAMAEPHRLQTLLALADGELCVCHLVELLRLRPGTVSRHLGILKHAGLIEMRRVGNWHHVRLPMRPLPAPRSALDWIFKALKYDPRARAVRRRAKAIRSMDKVDLCGHYRK